MVKAPAAPAKKLRILALHGGYQNGPSFDTLRLKDFKRRLKDICEITCLSGPIIAEGGADADDLINQKCQWFNWDANDPMIFEEHIYKPSLKYHKLQEMLDYIENAWTTQGPFDGILGFSQGSIATSTWLYWRRLGKDLEAAEDAAITTHEDDPKFFLSIGGMMTPRPENFPAYFKLSPENPIANPIPSFHAWGETDTFVTPETSKIFADIWGGETWTHAGKHFIPQSGAACTRFRQFLEPFANGDMSKPEGS